MTTDGGIRQQEAHQLVGLGKTPHHSTLKSRQTFNVLSLVTLRQTVTELFDSLAAASVLRAFVQYLTAFCS